MESAVPEGCLLPSTLGGLLEDASLGVVPAEERRRTNEPDVVEEKRRKKPTILGV